MLIFDFFYVPSQATKPSFYTWTSDQVSDWLIQNYIEDLVSVFKREKINGVCLKELALLTKDFSFFKNYLKEDFQVSSQGSILRLFAALKALL